MKVAKTNAVVPRPVSRLDKIEGKNDNVNSDILNKENVNTESGHSANTSNEPKKQAANNLRIKTQIHRRHKMILPLRECLNILSLLRYFATCFLSNKLFLSAQAHFFS